MSKKILIVEDDEAIRSTLSDLLEMEGFSVFSKVNGQEGLDYLLSTSDLPDLILLDLMMPVLDGIGFCQEKQKRPGFSHIPIIIMTAQGHSKEKQIEAQVSHYLKKPLDFEKLLAAINNVLS